MSTAASPPPTAFSIWGRTVRLAVDTARLGGLPMARLFEGLPFDEETIRTRREVAWDDYCVIIERLEALAGGEAEAQDLMASIYHQTAPELRSLVGIVASPVAFTRFVLTVVNPVMFAPTENRVDELGPNRFRYTVNVRPGARPCAALWRITIGTLRGFPCHLGLPEAEVISEITPERAVYEVTLPEPPPRLERIRAVSRALRARVSIALGYEDDGVGVIIGETPFGEAVSTDADVRAQAAARLWSLTPRQAQVLAHVARGKSNKEIGSDLGCAESTVEVHVTSVLRKAEATSRAELISKFWADL